MKRPASFSVPDRPDPSRRKRTMSEEERALWESVAKQTKPLRKKLRAAKAAAERQARGFLQAAEHHADHVFNFASKSDRGSYFDFMFDALRGDLAGKARVSGHTPTDPKPGRRR